MRVLMLNRPDVSTVPGGDTVQMERTKAGLERLGVEVKIGSAQEIGATPAYDIIHIFNWQWLGPIIKQWPQGVPVRRMVLSPIFWFHSGHWFVQASAEKPLWKLLRKFLGMKRACRLYESWQQEKFCWGNQGKELRELLKMPDQLLPNSAMEADYLEKVLGLHGRLCPRSMVVPNGIDAAMFDPLPAPDRGFLAEYGLKDFVIEVARIQSAKNQLGLIEALFDVPVAIVFVGQPSPYEDAYVSRCYERARQRGNVFFLGQRAPEQLFGIISQAAVHVLPSWRETPGLASLEAAAAGCRIVSTSIGSAREYFGEDAWYCDPRDPITIREAVLLALRSSPSVRLRERILKKYTWDEAAKATYQAYCKVIDPG
jgi:glycosyltransferase involved in cell wall biosynthesis